MAPTSSLEREELVLLFAPVGRDAQLLHDVLDRAQLISKICSSLNELCSEMELGAGAVFVTEEALPHDAVEKLAAIVEHQPIWSDLPIIVLTIGGEPNRANRNRLVELGPLGDITLLDRPLRSDTIVSAARTALRARARQYEVRRRDAELQLVTNNVPVLISYVDREQVFRRVNQTFQDWFGVSPGEVVGQSIQSVMGDPYFTNAQMYISRAIFGERVTFESQLWDRNRLLRDVNVSYAPDFAADGTVRGFVALVQDITGLKKVERALSESEEQFRTLADSIPHLAWVANADGHVFWYNQRWYEYTGTRPEAVEGWGWQSVHDPEVLPKVLERWKDSLASGRAFEMVFPLRGADGAYRLFLTRVVPVRDRWGAVARWFGTHTDIDEQKRTEEALRRANRDLEEFAYVASHDLQEPLRMVNAYSQLLLRRLGPLSDPQLKQYSDYVTSGVKRMEALIGDLLTYSRVTHVEREAVAARANLETVLQQALIAVEARVRENHAEITSDPLPVVAADEGQMVHVFQNLLSNALKYRKREVGPRIDIGAEKNDGHWVIHIRDNGIGFEQDQAVRIFGLFKRLHRHEEYPGTGLGLAICQHIVERYRGRIWAQSQPGEGSTFFISLPAAPHA